MVFSSFVFLCLFLPAAIILSSIFPSVKAKNFILTLLSLLFYAYCEPYFVIVLLAVVFLHYIIGLVAARKSQFSKISLIFLLVIDVLLLFGFKYLGFSVNVVNELFGLALPVPQIRLPIGISFFTFQIMSYIIDAYRDTSRIQKNFLDLLLYISFFPQLIAGPIVKYTDIETQLSVRKTDYVAMSRGWRRFLVGMSKKVFFADTMAHFVDEVYALPGVDTPTAWLVIAAYTLQIYYDFSGYSDMAIGIGQMLGFRLPENFNDPYAADSVSDFWRRWHMTLTAWFREYIYIPLGGNRKGTARTLLNIVIVFLFTGIWHGANFTFFVWGIYFAVFMVAERIGIIPVRKIKTKVFSHIYTLLVVGFGFAVFRADNLSQGFGIIRACFGFGTIDTIATVLPYVTPFFVCMLLLAVIGCLPIRKKVMNLRFAEPVSYAATAILLVLDLIMLITNSYSPFIYFNF